MPILTPYSSLGDQTSSSPNWDTISTPKANDLRKLVQKFEGDPTAGSKVKSILTSYSSLAEETSSSPSSDFKATIRK